uniref:Pep_M12B_propep domain-containing protein n=1 Tax=Gongylonema pulchrum TaxID=637853 RepID=A0A183DJT8_9BILA
LLLVLSSLNRHLRSLPILENNRIRPIVQFLDSLDATHARMSRFIPDCLYSAHVEGATESSIVNLCDISGGLFGTLALPDGTYLVEPVKDDQKQSKPSSSKAHIVYKSRSHSFHKCDFSSPSSSFAATTTTAATAASYLTVDNTANYVETHNYTAYRITNDSINSDAITAYYTNSDAHLTGNSSFSQLSERSRAGLIFTIFHLLTKTILNSREYSDIDIASGFQSN